MKKQTCQQKGNSGRYKHKHRKHQTNVLTKKLRKEQLLKLTWRLTSQEICLPPDMPLLQSQHAERLTNQRTNAPTHQRKNNTPAHPQTDKRTI